VAGLIDIKELTQIFYTRLELEMPQQDLAAHPELNPIKLPEK